jgi:hypothetical protein
MAVERAGTATLLDVLEHLAEGGVVVIGDAKFEASGAEAQGRPAQDTPPSPASFPRNGDPPATS